jgi:phage regulator Rha-like protein
MYLLPRARTIDGIIVTETTILLYQVKFTSKAPQFKPTFVDEFIALETTLQRRFTDRSTQKLLFTYSELTQSDYEEFTANNILICTDLKRLLGKTMIDWLLLAKQTKIGA